MAFIRINMPFVTEPGEPPAPQELVDLVVGKMRNWLSERGLEGELDVLDKDGTKIPSLKVLKPAEWVREDMQAFAAQAGEHLKSILAELGTEGEEPEAQAQ